MADAYTYQKKRKEFGKHAQFEDTDTKIVGSIPPDAAQAKNYHLKDPNAKTLTNVPFYSQHSVSIINISYIYYIRLTLKELRLQAKVCSITKEDGH